MPKHRRRLPSERIPELTEQISKMTGYWSGIVLRKCVEDNAATHRPDTTHAWAALHLSFNVSFRGGWRSTVECLHRLVGRHAA